MDLIYFIKALYRKKWIIILLSFIAVAATFVFLIYKKPLYVSVAQYSTGFTAEKVKLTDGTAAIDLYSVDVKFDNVIETIKSPQVVNRISYSLMLHDLLNPASSYRRLNIRETEKLAYRQMNKDTAKKILVQKLANNQMLRTDIPEEDKLIEFIALYKYDYETLMKYLNVNRVARTDYLDINFSSENAELSAWVVNSMGTEFLNYYKKLNTLRNDESAESIKSLLDAQQSKVDSLNTTLLTEKMSQGTIDPVSRTTSAMETVTEIESRLADEKSKYNLHINKVNYLSERLATLEQNLASGGGSNDEVVRLTNKKNELLAEMNRKGGNDPALQQQINSIRTEIILKSNSGVNRNKLKQDIDDINKELSEERAAANASDITIREYNSRIQKYMGMTNANPASGVKMDVIKTRLDMENLQLKNVKERFSQIQGLQKDDPTSNFIQTRLGLPAPKPESKKTLLKMGLAGISVFLFSALIFIFLEVFDSSVKTPLIFNRISRLKSTLVLNKLNLKKTNVLDIVMEENEGKKFDNQNNFKNNIRKLRFELLNSNKQVFLFTSTQKQTGKTTVIEALAASLLLSHKKVLLIDLNFSNNTLTRDFNTDIHIQDVIQKIRYDEPLFKQKLVGSTAYDNLKIIGCKNGNITPSEVFDKTDMNNFINAFAKEFDFIIIEGAALNFHADTREIETYSQALFCVFSADSTISQVDQESIRYLTTLKEKNQGTILNKVLLENINS